MTTKIANRHQISKDSVDRLSRPLRARLPEFALIFLVTCILLFLGMCRRPGIYDEGLVLTAAMRVAAGQIPHRDFYANYGPAQFYILAGLFKIFGESILVERLFDLFIKGLLVVSVYAIVLSYCRRSVAAITSAITVLWLFVFNVITGTPVVPVCLLNLAGVASVLPVFQGRVSTRRMFAAGALAGIAALFRYDTGMALLVVQACTIAAATYLKNESSKLRAFAFTFATCLLGFLVVTLPIALYYLSVAPIHPFVHDIILYPSKYYHRGRNLPFPGISRGRVGNLEIYLPIAAISISLYVAVAANFRGRGDARLNFQDRSEEQRWHGFLIAFGLLSLFMYFKGFVRLELSQMYLCIVPSLLLTAVLFQNISAFSHILRFAVMGLVTLSALAVTSSTKHELGNIFVYDSIPDGIVSSSRTSAEIGNWCKSKNPLTRGVCFLPEDDSIRTIEFVDSHTLPNQRLYVGLAKHDRVFANNNLIYFGASRLPATRWSHFDPGLQNSRGIQAQMAEELEVNSPPYVVLDSEFESQQEPNDSSKSTGVTLLDDYIRSKYQPVQTFGSMSIWVRTTNY